MAQKMRAVDVKNGAGPPSALFISDSIDRPQPSEGECLVRVKAFGLNRADTLQREGKYPVPPGVTKIMGLEFAGIIEEVGHGKAEDERHHWKEGDEVFGLAYGGGYAEYIAVNKKMLLKKPAAFSWECCAGVCETWMTALQALYLVGQYDPATTKSILWHAGASSVSIAGIQLSLHANADNGAPPPKVFATARQDSKCDFCVKTLGCTAAINATKNEGRWADAVLEANGGNGFDLVIDYIGAPYFQQNLEVLARDGRVVQLGVMGGTTLPEGVDISAFLRKRARFEGSTLRSRTPDYQEKLRDLFEQKVLPSMLEAKTKGTKGFEHHIDQVFKWQDIQKAHEYIESNQSQGKIVCVVE